MGNFVLPDKVAKVTELICNLLFNPIHNVEEITSLHMCHITLRVNYSLLLRKYEQKVERHISHIDLLIYAYKCSNMYMIF
jgi:hypothetical protein